MSRLPRTLLLVSLSLGCVWLARAGEPEPRLPKPGTVLVDRARGEVVLTVAANGRTGHG